MFIGSDPVRLIKQSRAIMAASYNSNRFAAAAKLLPKVAAQTELGSRWRSWRSAHPVGWLSRLSLTIRNGQHRWHLAGRLHCADHLATLGHAIRGIEAFVFGVAARAGPRRRIAGNAAARTLHAFHAARHVDIGDRHVGVSGYAYRRCHGFRAISRNSRKAWRKRQRDRDQNRKYGTNDVQVLRHLHATIMKPSDSRSRHD